MIGQSTAKLNVFLLLFRCGNMLPCGKRPPWYYLFSIHRFPLPN